jgi:hypothetical protein
LVKVLFATNGRFYEGQFLLFGVAISFRKEIATAPTRDIIDQNRKTLLKSKCIVGMRYDKIPGNQRRKECAKLAASVGNATARPTSPFG